MGGDGNVVVSSRLGDRLGGRKVISSRMDLRFGGWYMGTNFLRNFLFLSVCLPDPSTLVKLAHFDYCASPVSFVWVKTSLILDPHVITNL